VDANLKEYDLSIQNRDKTEDEITTIVVDAIKHYKVAIKCSTITPTDVSLKKYHLKKLWRSPNATIRHALNGVIFSKHILFKHIPKIYTIGGTRL